MIEIGVRFLTLIQQMQALGSPRSYPAGDRFAARGLIRWEGVLSLRIRLLRPAVFLAGTFLRIVFLDAVLLAVTFLRVVLLRVALLRVVFFAFDSREAVFVPAATFLAAGWCLTMELLLVGDISSSPSR